VGLLSRAQLAACFCIQSLSFSRRNVLARGLNLLPPYLHWRCCDVDLLIARSRQDALRFKVFPPPSLLPNKQSTPLASSMSFFAAPQALRLRSPAASSSEFVAMASQSYEYGSNGMFNVFKNTHSAHPDFANLTLLVFEAVMEVVCVSAPGYIVARMGQFDAESQKFLANLNTQLFTPCLSTCTLDKERPRAIADSPQFLPSSRRN
jgi:hypothetical protein